jgi:hypothetical protein
MRLSPRAANAGLPKSPKAIKPDVKPEMSPDPCFEPKDQGC